MARRTALLLAFSAILLGRSAAAAQDAPTLECEPGFETIRASVLATPGAEIGEANRMDIVVLPPTATWKVVYTFTQAGHPAHPSVTLQTRRKQVTGVWTAQRKGCGYGPTAEFNAMMADFKAIDHAATEASRAEAERNKTGASPLAPPM